MKRYGGDLEATRKKWRNLYDLADDATKVYDEEQRMKKGKSIIVSDEEEDEEMFSFSEYVPRNIRSSLRYPHENLNGASTSSSLHHLLHCFESSSSLLYNTAEPKSPPNTSRKRVARETMPEWLVEVMRKMNVDEDPPRLVFEKPLSASDVNSNLSRLLIPFNKLFLTHAEIQAIEKEDVDEENIGVGTILVNKNSEKWGLRLKVLLMQGTLNYALNWGWNDVVKCNNLKARDEISLWSFRCRGVLCFALEHRVP